MQNTETKRFKENNYFKTDEKVLTNSLFIMEVLNMKNMVIGQQIWELVDTIENTYLTREFSIWQVSEKLGISVYDVRKTLELLGYDHTLKRNLETRLHGKLIYGVLTPEKFSFLEKYIDKEEE